jgi:hypothetical protein
VAAAAVDTLSLVFRGPFVRAHVKQGGARPQGAFAHVLVSGYVQVDHGENRLEQCVGRECGREVRFSVRVNRVHSSWAHLGQLDVQQVVQELSSALNLSGAPWSAPIEGVCNSLEPDGAAL